MRQTSQNWIYAAYGRDRQRKMSRWAACQSSSITQALVGREEGVTFRSEVQMAGVDPELIGKAPCIRARTGPHTGIRSASRRPVPCSPAHMHRSAWITLIYINMHPLVFLQLSSFSIPSQLCWGSAPSVSLLLATVPLSVRSASAHHLGNFYSSDPLAAQSAR
jgi:hypothetical protein